MEVGLDVGSSKEGSVAAVIADVSVNTLEMVACGGEEGFSAANEGVQMEMVPLPDADKWVNNTRKGKKSVSKSGPKKDPICSLNSFAILDTDLESSDAIHHDPSPDNQVEEIREEMYRSCSQTLVENGNVETCEEGDENTVFGSLFEENKFEEDKEDEMDARKMKVLKHFDAPVKSLTVIEKISGLLGDTSGKETSLFCALNDTYTKSWKDRELGKLGWKEDPNNDKLGRGHRKPSKKK